MDGGKLSLADFNLKIPSEINNELHEFNSTDVIDLFACTGGTFFLCFSKNEMASIYFSDGKNGGKYSFPVLRKLITGK